MMLARSIVAVVALGLATSTSGEYISSLKGVNSDKHKRCPGAWKCPKDIYELCADDGKSYYNRCVLHCESEGATIKSEGLCYDDLKDRHAKCGKYDDKRISCESAPGCAFNPDANAGVLGDGFVDNQGGVVGTSVQFECWDVVPKVGEDSDVFKDRCAKQGKKDGQVQKCEAQIEENGDSTFMNCQAYSPCKMGFDKKTCEAAGKGAGKSCEFNSMKATDGDGKETEETYCVEKINMDGEGGNADGVDGEGDGLGDSFEGGCFGFRPEIKDGETLVGNLVDKDGKTAKQYCDSVVDDNSNKLCQYKNITMEGGLSYEECTVYSKCEGKAEDECKKTSGCETQGTGTEYAGCFPDIADGGTKSDVSCGIIRSEDNCKAAKNDAGDAACAYTTSKENICESKTDSDQSFPAAQESDCGDDYVFKKDVEVGQCGSVCDAAAGDKDKCAAAGCCYDSLGSFCMPKEGDKCQDFGADGGDMGAGGGEDNTDESGETDKAECYMQNDDKNKCNQAKGCKWREETYMSACTSTKAGNITDAHNAECMAAADEAECDKLSQCKSETETNGFCSDDNKCLGNDVQEKCEAITDCVFLEDEFLGGGVCQVGEKIEEEAQNGTCKFDSQRNRGDGSDLNIFIDEQDKDGIIDAFSQGVGCSSAQNKSACGEIKDEFGMNRCSYTAIEAEGLMCHNTTAGGKQDPPTDGSVAQPCMMVMDKDNCNKNDNCAWTTADGSTPEELFQCATMELDEAEACARFSDSYTCDDVPGCRFEEKGKDMGGLGSGVPEMGSGSGVDSFDAGLGAFSACQQGQMSKDKCLAIKNADKEAICVFTKQSGIGFCGIDSKWFDKQSTGDMTTEFPECDSNAANKEECEKVKDCAFEEPEVFDCIPKPHKCTTFKKTACLADDDCNYNPPNKGICSEPLSANPMNMTKEQEKIALFCRCDASVSSTLSFDKDACEAKGCAYFSADSAEGPAQPDLDGVQSTDSNLVCTPKRKAADNEQPVQGDDGEGAGNQAWDECACYKEPDGKTCKAQSEFDGSDGGADGSDGAAGGGLNTPAGVDTFDVCAQLSNKDGCNSKTIKGSKACAWAELEQQFECGSACQTITDETTCSGAAGCEFDNKRCKAKDGDVTAACRARLLMNDAGQLNRTHCSLDDKCGAVPMSAASGFCTPYDKCAAVTNAKVCEVTDGCTYDANLKACQAVLADLPCQSTDCCFSEVMLGDGAKDKCNNKKLTDGTRACKFSEPQSGGFCVSESDEAGKECDFDAVFKKQDDGVGEQSACASTDGCAYSKMAAIDGTCEPYDVCSPSGQQLDDKDSCEKLKANGTSVCVFLKETLSNTTQCINRKKALESAGDGFDIDGGDLDFVNPAGKDKTQEENKEYLKFNAPCMFFFEEQGCVSAATKGSKVPRCMYSDDGTCGTYDICRSKKATENERACETTEGCKWKRDSASSMEGTCGKAPSKLVSGGNYTCVPFYGDDSIEDVLGGASSGDRADFSTEAPTTPAPATGCCKRRVYPAGSDLRLTTCLEDYTQGECDADEAELERKAVDGSTFWAEGACDVSACPNLATTAVPTTPKTVAPELNVISEDTKLFIVLKDVRVTPSLANKLNADTIARSIRFNLGLNLFQIPSGDSLKFPVGGIVVAFAGVSAANRPTVGDLEAAITKGQNTEISAKVEVQTQDLTVAAGFTVAEKRLARIASITVYEGALDAANFVATYPTVPPTTVVTRPVTAKTTAAPTKAPKGFGTTDMSTSSSTAGPEEHLVDLGVKCNFNQVKQRNECKEEALKLFLKLGELEIPFGAEAEAVLDFNTKEVAIQFIGVSYLDVIAAEAQFNKAPKKEKAIEVDGFNVNVDGVKVAATTAPPKKTKKVKTTRPVDLNGGGERVTTTKPPAGNANAGASEGDDDGVDAVQIVVVVIVMLFILVGGIVVIYLVRKRMEERGMEMGSAMQTYGNPVYAQGPGGPVDEAGDGYLDVAEGAKKPANAAPAKKGLVRQESLC